MKKTILAITLLLPLSAMAAEWTGTVVGIADGDTVTVLNEQKKQVKIRLVEIDAPEKKQAFGEQSKQSLSDICFKKPVIVDDKGSDKYKRTLGRLRCDGVDANAEQVKRGMAWAYKQYLTDQSIADLEQVAKNSGTGLWTDENPTPPWDFRHGKKAVALASNDTDTTDNGYITGPRGGCYKLTASGKKRYVDHSYCR
jgi:endonuclease YncB( thermonuclease family)